MSHAISLSIPPATAPHAGRSVPARAARSVHGISNIIQQTQQTTAPVTKSRAREALLGAEALLGGGAAGGAVIRMFLEITRIPRGRCDNPLTRCGFSELSSALPLWVAPSFCRAWPPRSVWTRR
jgi:hypothetical protein